METGRVTLAGGYSVAWVIAPRRRWFSWVVYSTSNLGTGELAVGTWTFWTRRAARAKIGWSIAEVIALSEAATDAGSPDPMNRG